MNLKYALASYIIILYFVFFKSAFSAALMVDPVGIIFNKNEIETIKVMNHDDQDVIVHLLPRDWSQNSENEFVLTPTQDILVVPEIVKIDRKSSQIVRIAFQGKRQNDIEKSYRLLIKELPISNQSKANSPLNIALELSIPIFISPLKESNHRFDWEFVNVDENITRLIVKNTGFKHLLINDIYLKDNNNNLKFHQSNIFHYILPDKTITIDLTLPHEISKNLGMYTINF